MKRLKIGLLARIIIAITLGIGFGNVLPGELVRVFPKIRNYHSIHD
jgi:Na+/H+-dicarboxylate symporter